MRLPRLLPLALLTAVTSLAVPSAVAAAPVWLPAASAAGASSADLQLAYDGMGNAIAVWRKSFDGADSVWTSTRPATSATFGTAKRLSTAPASGEQPQVSDLALAVDAQGSAVVVWTSRFTTGASPDVVMARRSADAWSPAQTISDGTAASSPSVAFQSSGTAFVAWRQTTPDYTQVRVSSIGVGSGNMAAVQSIAPASGDAAQPRLAFDGQGHGVLTWVESAVSFSPPYVGEITVRAMTRKASAATFTGSQLVYSTRNVTIDDLDVALDATGNATIVWGDRSSDTGAPQGVFASTRVLGGTSWPGAPVSTTGSEPEVAASNAGGAVVTWVEPKSGAPADTGAIFAAHRPAGTTNFASGVRLSDEDELAGAVSVAAAAGGTTVVTWARRSGSAETVRATVKAPSTEHFWPGHDLDASSSAVGTPVAAVTPTGDALALWQPAGTASTLQRLAQLDGATVSAAPAPQPDPAEPEQPQPTTPTDPVGTTPGDPAPTTPSSPQPTTPASGGGTPTTPQTPTVPTTTTPTNRAPVVSVAKSPESAATTAAAPGTAQATAATALLPSLRSFKALAAKRFAPARRGDGLVARGDGLPLAATGNLPGTLRIVVTSTPKGGRAKNLKPALSLPVEEGTTKFVFTGRLAGKPLPAGLYTLKAVFVDEDGRASNRRELPIAVKR